MNHLAVQRSEALHLLDLPKHPSADAVMAAFHREAARLCFGAGPAGQDGGDLRRLEAARDLLLSDVGIAVQLAQTEIDDLPVLVGVATNRPPDERHRESPIIKASQIPTSNSAASNDDDLARWSAANGRRLADRYRLGDVLGVGRLTITCTAQDESTGRELVVKILRQQWLDRPSIVSALESQVRDLVSQRPAGIVPVIGFQRTADAAFVVGERASGKCLADELADRRAAGLRATPAEARRWIEAAASALTGLGPRVHGHLSPRHLWLQPQGGFLISGLETGGRARAAASEFANDGRGTSGLDSRDDQRAIAAIGYEALTGEPPGDHPEPLEIVRPNLPPGLSAVIMRALAARPKKRYGSLRAFRAALANAGKPSRLGERITVFVAMLLLIGGPLGWRLLRPQPRFSRADFAQYAGQVAELRKQIDAQEKDLQGAAKASKDELEKWQRELLTASESGKKQQEQFARARIGEIEREEKRARVLWDLWEHHQQRGQWLAAATGAASAAAAHEKDEDFDAAMEQMRLEDESLQKLVTWRKNSGEALEGADKARQMLSAAAAKLGDAPPESLVFAERNLADVEGSLTRDDGAAALEKVRQTVRFLTDLPATLKTRAKARAAEAALPGSTGDPGFAADRRRIEEQSFAEGETALAAGNLAAAEERYLSAQRAWEALPQAYLKSLVDQAEEDLKAGRRSAALAEAKAGCSTPWKSAALKPLLARLEFVAARIYKDDGDFPAAVQSATRAKQQDTTLRGVDALNAELQFALGDDVAALASCDAALKSEPRSLDMLILKARTELDRLQLKKALATVEQASAVAPESTTVATLRAAVLLAAGEREQSLAICDPLANRKPPIAAALAVRSVARRLANQNEQAIADARQAIAAEADSAEAHEALYEALWAAGQQGEARAAARAAASSLAGSGGRRLAERARFQYLASQFSQAIANSDQALAMSDQNILAHAVRGQALVAQKDWEKALGDLTVAIKGNPQFPGLFAQRAKALAATKQYAAAVDDCDQALKLEPNGAETLALRALLRAASPQASLRSGSKAFDDAMRAYKLEGAKDPRRLAILAAAYAESGDFETAIRWQRKAIAAAPNDAEFRERGGRDLESYRTGQPLRRVTVD